MKVSRVVIAVLCAVSLLPATLYAAEATVDLPVNSAYVWRGQVLNNEPVFEPSITVSTEYGLTLNTWANFNLTDSLGEDQEREFNETDLTISYDLPLEVVDVTVGVAEYMYPNQSGENDDGSAFSLPNTHEAFVSVGKEDLLLSPSASLYYDFGQAKAWYGMVSVSEGFEATKELSFDLTVSLGASDSTYNEYYFGVDEVAVNDGNVKAGADYALTESVTLSAYAMYTRLLDSEIRNAAKDNDAYFNRGDILSGGVSVGYGF